MMILFQFARIAQILEKRKRSPAIYLSGSAQPYTHNGEVCAKRILQCGYYIARLFFEVQIRQIIEQLKSCL